MSSLGLKPRIGYGAVTHNKKIESFLSGFPRGFPLFSCAFGYAGYAFGYVGALGQGTRTMHKPMQTPPDTILAHARVLHITDRLLDVAEELRAARDNLQSLFEDSANEDGQAEATSR